jgi:hypothetical protein
MGTYIAFLDSDDLWFPWTLATYEELIQHNCSPAFIAGKPLRFEREEQLTGVAASPVESAKFPDYFASGDEWRWWGVSSFVIRTDALRATGGFAEVNMNGEDADLAMKLGTAPGFVQVTAPFTFGYREHGNKLTGELSKSVAGIWHKIRAERTGTYPGGRARARERWKILTRHIRPVTIACLNQGLRGDAWAFYFASFRWHLVLRRGKYLAGFPLVALASSTPRAEPPSSSTVRTGRSRDQNPFGVLIERCRGGCGR